MKQRRGGGDNELMKMVIYVNFTNLDDVEIESKCNFEFECLPGKVVGEGRRVIVVSK